MDYAALIYAKFSHLPDREANIADDLVQLHDNDPAVVPPEEDPPHTANPNPVGEDDSETEEVIQPKRLKRTRSKIVRFPDMAASINAW